MFCNAVFSNFADIVVMLEVNEHPLILHFLNTNVQGAIYAMHIELNFYMEEHCTCYLKQEAFIVFDEFN